MDRHSLFAGVALLLLGTIARAETLNLAGEWKLLIDPQGVPDAPPPGADRFRETLRLPGTLAEAGKGAPLTIRPSVGDKRAMEYPLARFSYEGPAWYAKDIDIPADWKGRDAELLLERVMWESRVMVNGEPAGACNSLCTPHRYEIGKYLRPGRRNRILIRVDNRRMVDLGYGHAYSLHAGPHWNGIVGRIELTDRPATRVDAVRAFAAPDGDSIRVTVTTINGGGATGAELRVKAVAAGKTTARWEGRLNLKPGATETTLELPAAGLGRWSEFTPETASLSVELVSGDDVSSMTVPYGARTLTTRGTRILIDGIPAFFRGTHDGGIFPLTGYPPTDTASWEKIMGTVKAYGLNHVRFHSWCPPEAAFAAADRHGVYLQVELPNWSFEMGRKPAADAFFRAEGGRILREYGNHPSFVLLSLGNELTGDLAFMDTMLREFKALRPDKLMTSTTFSFSERGKHPGPADDYFISQQTSTGWIRGQGFLNDSPPSTDSDYSAGAASVGIPLLSHEIGQFAVYPDLAELPKFDGVMRAAAWEAIRDNLKAKGRLSEAARYTRDSGMLAVELYKEEIERALRTPDLSGFQLLDLHDYTGQCAATVGILDAFWDSKGLVSPETFRGFAGPVVPLALMPRRVWENGDVFQARVRLANFGARPFDTPLDWKLTDGENVVASGRFPASVIPVGERPFVGDIAAPLSAVRRAAKLTLEVSATGTAVKNTWDIWVYPFAAEPRTANARVVEKWNDAVIEDLKRGARIVLTPNKSDATRPIDARFVPPFWSPLYFTAQAGTFGASIDSDHPAFAAFPTATYTQWQWWELFSHAWATDLTPVSPRPRAPLTFVDKFQRNAIPAAIWECRIGKGSLLVCTLDIANRPGRIAARQLRRSLLNYADSSAFAPEVALDDTALASIFKATPATPSQNPAGPSRNEPGNIGDLGIIPGFNDK